MSDKIVVNIMRFDGASTGISNVREDLKNSKETLKKCNTILSEKWKGKSSDKFFKTYNTLDENFSVYLEELDNLVKKLNNIKNTFIEKENDLQRFIEDNKKPIYDKNIS